MVQKKIRTLACSTLLAGLWMLMGAGLPRRSRPPPRKPPTM